VHACYGQMKRRQKNIQAVEEEIVIFKITKGQDINSDGNDSEPFSVVLIG